MGRRCWRRPARYGGVDVLEDLEVNDVVRMLTSGCDVLSGAERWGGQ